MDPLHPMSSLGTNAVATGPRIIGEEPTPREPPNPSGQSGGPRLSQICPDGQTDFKNFPNRSGQADRVGKTPPQSVKNRQKIEINFQGPYEVKERIGEHIQCA